MGFKFTLQKILDLRTLETNEAQRQVDATQQIIRQLKGMLEEERQHYFSERDSLNNSILETHFANIKVYEDSLQLRQNRMMELLKSLRDVQDELAFKQATLLNAKKNKKIMEKIHDLKKKEHEKRESVKEQNTLDEIGMQRFLKSKWEEEFGDG